METRPKPSDKRRKSEKDGNPDRDGDAYETSGTDKEIETRCENEESSGSGSELTRSRGIASFKDKIPITITIIYKNESSLIPGSVYVETMDVVFEVLFVLE